MATRKRNASADGATASTEDTATAMPLNLAANLAAIDVQASKVLENPVAEHPVAETPVAEKNGATSAALAQAQQQIEQLTQQVAGLKAELSHQTHLAKQALVEVTQLETSLAIAQTAAQQAQQQLQPLTEELSQAKDAAKVLAEQNYALTDQLAGLQAPTAPAPAAQPPAQTYPRPGMLAQRPAPAPSPAYPGVPSPGRDLPNRGGANPDRPVAFPSTEPDVGWFD